jgi:hypothetical protein
MRRQTTDVLTVEANGATGCAHQPGNGLQGRSLAGTVCAEKRNDLSLGDAEADTAERLDLAVEGMNLLDLEKWFVRQSSSSSSS